MAGAAAPWVHGPGGSYRVNGPTAPPGPAAAWQPPPILPGYYNPARDINIGQGKLTTDQALSGDERQISDAGNTYAANLGVLGQREGQQASDYATTLARLGESYKKLASSQEQGANQRGVLQGGALLQASMKRSANEALQKAADEKARSEQVQSNENERGRLSLAQSQLAGPGGSLVEAMQNARESQQAFEQGENALKAHEATFEHGYQAPTRPRVARPWTHLRGGAVRVGGRSY